MYQQQMQCDRFPIGRAWCFHSAEKDLDRCLLTAKIHSICPALNGTCLSTRDLGAPCQLPNLALGNLSFYALYHSLVFEHIDKTHKLFSSINPTFRKRAALIAHLAFLLVICAVFFFFSPVMMFMNRKIGLTCTIILCIFILGGMYTLHWVHSILCCSSNTSSAFLCSQRAWLYNYIMYVQRVFSRTTERILWDCRTF